MATLNPNIPTAELSRLMSDAAGRMSELNQKYLTPQLLLLSMLSAPKTAAHQLLTELAKQNRFDWADLERRLATAVRYPNNRDAQFNFTDDFGKDIPLNDEMLIVLDEALSIAKSRDEQKATTAHALAALTLPQVTTYGLLQKVGLTTQLIISKLAEITPEGTPIIHDYITEAQKGLAHAVYQRNELQQEMLQLLNLTQKRHIILVGPEGAGKRTLAYSLALLIAEGKTGDLDFRSLAEINEIALLEDPLAALRVGLRRATQGALLIPNIDRFFADRLRAPFPEQVNRDLHKAILNDDQVIIGCCTPVAYEKIATHQIIREHTHRLNVPPASRSESIAMLSYHKQRLQQEYEIELSRESLETAATIADQYIKTIALPASAVQLAERACAIFRIAHSADPENNQSLQPDDILIAASQMTKIPISKLGQDERSKYAKMEEHLHQRIIGQQEAVAAVSRAVKTARVGLRNPKRPIGSFLFLGPSGVGKSELAKAVAEFMFGSEDAMIVLDMSEYQEESSVNRLIGPPPGYVGFEGGGQLTDFVREKPYTVVLFDEIEKAHPRVLDVLLQLMEEGRLTDGQGRLTTFSETVVIMTSNLGAMHMLTPTVDELAKELVMGDVRQFLRPEFINRLDDVILFHQLTNEQLKRILTLMLKKEQQLAAQQEIILSVTDAAQNWLLAQNDQPEFGARPLRRIIARHLREKLADFLLSNERPTGKTTLTVDHQSTSNSLEFTFLSEIK